MKLVVYPFSKDSIEFWNSDSIIDTTQVVLLCPSSFFNPSSICGNTNTIVTHDCAEALDGADAVLIIPSFPWVAKRGYEQVIANAKRRNIPVYMCENVVKQFEFECDNTNLVSFEKSDIITNIEKQKDWMKYSIPVPVIVIYGAGPFSEKFIIESKVSGFFSKLGYNVAFWGTKEYSSLFGGKPLPSFLFESYSGIMKSTALNHYIYHDAITNKRDLVVLGIPGGIMSRNSWRFNDIGELAYIISNAVNPDISILSIYANPLDSEFLNELVSLCKYRFNANVSHINVASANYIFTDSHEEDFISVPHQEVMSYISDIGSYQRVFSVFDDAGLKQACNDILNILTSNI